MTKQHVYDQGHPSNDSDEKKRKENETHGFQVTDPLLNQSSTGSCSRSNITLVFIPVPRTQSHGAHLMSSRDNMFKV